MRTSNVVSRLVSDAYAQLELDRTNLAELKIKLQQNPADEMIAKQINALRVTIVNGAEDLQDLEAELKSIVVFEASEAGQAKRAAIHDKFRLAAAMDLVYSQTARNADQALSAAYVALRRMHAAHAALHEATGAAYGAVAEGSGRDTYGDIAFLVFSWMNMSNTAAPLAEWVEESLRGFNVEQHIQLHGVTLHHNQHVSLEATTSTSVIKALRLLDSFAKECGYEVPEPNDPAVQPLAVAVLGAINTSKVK